MIGVMVAAAAVETTQKLAYIIGSAPEGLLLKPGKSMLPYASSGVVRPGVTITKTPHERDARQALISYISC